MNLVVSNSNFVFVFLFKYDFFHDRNSDLCHPSMLFIHYRTCEILFMTKSTIYNIWCKVKKTHKYVQKEVQIFGAITWVKMNIHYQLLVHCDKNLYIVQSKFYIFNDHILCIHVWINN